MNNFYKLFYNPAAILTTYNNHGKQKCKWTHNVNNNFDNLTADRTGARMKKLSAVTMILLSNKTTLENDTYILHCLQARQPAFITLTIYS